MAGTEYGMDAILPYYFQRRMIDPAPPASEPSNLPITAPVSSNGVTTGSAPHPVAPSAPAPAPKVLQQYEFEFVFSVPRLSASTTDRALGFPFKSIFEDFNYTVPTLNLWVVQPCYPQNSRVLRGYNWEIWFETEKLETIQADDNGPAFTEAALTQVTVCPATSPDNGGFSYNRTRNFTSYKVQRQLDAGATVYEVSSVNSALVVVICKFVFSRRFSRTDWNLLSCGRVPAPKCSLLESAARTGDVLLKGGENVEAAAHSAILVDVPYFEAKLRDEWSGTAAWNLHNKLHLRLPCDVSKGALDAFLHYLYGDTRSLFGIDPWASPLLKDVLSLADACGIQALCDDVVHLVIVTPANVNAWLEWLLQEHGSIDVEPIRKQVGEVMQRQLQTALQGQTLTVEQLAAISLSLAHPEGLS